MYIFWGTWWLLLYIFKIKMECITVLVEYESEYNETFDHYSNVNIVSTQSQWFNSPQNPTGHISIIFMEHSVHARQFKFLLHCVIAWSWFLHGKWNCIIWVHRLCTCTSTSNIVTYNTSDKAHDTQQDFHFSIKQKRS